MAHSQQLSGGGTPIRGCHHILGCEMYLHVESQTHVWDDTATCAIPFSLPPPINWICLKICSSIAKQHTIFGMQQLVVPLLERDTCLLFALSERRGWVAGQYGNRH